MSSDHDFGDAVDIFVQAHFRALGHELGFPRRDNGTDFLISLDGGPYQRVQVKHLARNGRVKLRPPSSGGAATQEECRAASKTKRPYDILVIACAERMWTIPESATRGITTITLKNNGKWLVKTKWNQYLQERQTWVKRVSAACR